MLRYRTNKNKWDTECLEDFKSRMIDILELKDYHKKSRRWFEAIRGHAIEFGEGKVIVYNGLRKI
jgi:hypothetical protein